MNWEKVISDSHSEDLFKVVQDNFLKQIVTEPNRSANLLDIILTDNENIISELEEGGELSCNDHREIRFTLDRRITQELNPM